MRRGLAALAAVSLAIGLVAACKERPALVVPGPTTARPDPAWPILSDAVRGKAHDAGAADAAVAAVAPVAPVASSVPSTPVPRVVFAAAGGAAAGGPCTRIYVVPAKGPLRAEVADPAGPKVQTHELARGDVLVATNARRVTVRGDAVVATLEHGACAVDDHPPLAVSVVRGDAARELRWAKGAMTAHLDVGAPLSPELYVGRLAGTAPVAEHVHATSTEVLAALEGAGTFTLDGKDQRLVAPQIVVVPPNTKHAWKPDPGSKLVAIQMYAPPGPEQRFVGLDAAERDAGAR